MRYVKSDPAGRDVQLSSPAPVLAGPGYDKILGAVKSTAPTVTCWRRGQRYLIASGEWASKDLAMLAEAGFELGQIEG